MILQFGNICLIEIQVHFEILLLHLSLIDQKAFE